MERLEKVTAVSIAGGGPGGLAAALALRRLGFAATTVDCAVPPIDKACGEGLLPDSLAALKRLGVEFDEDAGHPLRGIRFTDGASTVTADFPDGAGLGVRRSHLHRKLAEQARAAGVRSIWGAKNVALQAAGLSFEGGFVPADFVVGADGLKSAVRRAAGLDHFRSEKRRYGFRIHYQVAPWSDYVEVHCGPRGQAYVTPVAKNEVCVVSVSRHPQVRLSSALEDFPALRERLAGAPHGSAERGATSLSRVFKRVYQGNVALLGDASGSVDAVTGEGLGLAFQQALALAEALRAGDLALYAARHAQISARPRRLAALLLALDRHDGLRRRALASLAKRPDLVTSLVRLHSGDGWRGLPAKQVFGFGWDFLAA